MSRPDDPIDPIDPKLSDDEEALRKERIDIQRKVSLKFKEFRGFITEFSENISAGGMFIRTTRPQSPGSIFDFELTLGEDYTLIHGLGEVVWVRDEDEGFDRPAGMGVRFLSLDPDSRRLIDEIVSRRLESQGGDGELGPLDGWGMGEGVPMLTERDPGEAGSEDLPSREGPFDLAAPPIAGSTSSTEPVEPSAGASASGGALADPLEGGAGTEQETSEGVPKPRAIHSPYARSYHAAASRSQSSSSAGAKRPLTIALLALLGLAVLAAGFFLLFPDRAMELMVGGTDGERAGSPAASASSGVPTERAESPAPAVQRPPAETRAGAEEADGAAGPPVADGRPAEPPSVARPAEESPAGAEGADTEPSDRPGPAGGAGSSPARTGPEPPVATPPSPATSAPVPPAPEGDPFTRILNITWQQEGDQLVVTVTLDGVVREWDYSLTRIGAPPPRELIRIRGAQRPFQRTNIPVAADLIERIRTGFHPHDGEDEIHVVLDFAADDVVVERSEAVGREIRLYLGREQVPERRSPQRGQGGR